MRAVETNMTVESDGKAVIVLQLPPDVSAGEHRAVVVLDDRNAGELDAVLPAGRSLELPAHDFGPWPSGLSMRREEMYGDHGR
jgi:hypothetical protein